MYIVYKLCTCGLIELEIHTIEFTATTGKWIYNLRTRNLSLKPGLPYRLQTLKYMIKQWPNLKNLSGGLNLSRGLNMVGST